MTKKGQVTIFVILGMIIVVGGLVIYTLVGGPKSESLDVDEDPASFIQNCVEDDFQYLIENVSLNGGSLSPEHFYHYYGNNVEFLCYTDKYFEGCTKERHFLRSHIQEELMSGISPKIDECIDDLEQVFKDKGYIVTSEEKDRSVEIIKDRILLNINYSLFLEREESKNFDINVISFRSSVYSFVQIAKDIVEWEKAGLEVDTMYFMKTNYPIKVSKYRNTDDIKIYSLENRDTVEKFQFVIRSMSYPGGAA